MKKSGFLAEFGIEEANLENWLSRLTLRTSYAQTIPGRAREFSRKNVIELATINAFVLVGMRPSEAVAFAEVVVAEQSALRDPMRWFVFPAGRFDYGEQMNELDGEAMQELASKSPARAVIAVETGKIAERVHRLFDGANES